MPYKDKATRNAKANEYHKTWLAKHPEYRERRKSLPSYAQKTTESTLEARRSYWEVQKALKAGTLVRPTICEDCGASRFCEAAHLDYSKPLDIRWLCRSCHRLMDAANPNAGKEPLEASRERVARNEAVRIAAHACQHCGGWISEHPGRRKYCSHPCYVADRWGSPDTVQISTRPSPGPTESAAH